MAYTRTRQRPDGAWYYAEDGRYHWIDSFHTGYILSALRDYTSVTGDTDTSEALQRGRQFYVAHFFEADGCPRYYAHRRHPVDIQCAAQAIETLASLALDPRDLELATRVAAWTIEHMQHDDGHFDYRRLGRWRVRTPMLHWGQATMAKALAVLIDNLGARSL
jgi:rhamnogalacturonyl hydrolase YesR